ncbi:MAG: hypothetical protein HRU32_02580 [Rhodobacteraceae bacterium]|nr:hypothetical protein [Paracoccaceae bacterium]
MAVTKEFVLKSFAIATSLAVFATGAVAQQSTNRVSESSDWSVFQEDDPKECWSVSAPKETVNTRGGAVVDVRRGEILLFVRYEPGKSVVNEIAFTGGYPFAAGGTVSLDIGGTRYEMFTEGEWAWLGAQDDTAERVAELNATVLAAMKRGTEAVLTGRSSRGTTTKDTFSLIGFTAASDAAQQNCAS